MKTRINILFAVIAAAALLLSACVAEKRAPQNYTVPDNEVHIAKGKVAKLEIAVPAELGFMVRDVCSGRACGLIAQADKQSVTAAAMCPFPATATAPEPVVDRQAGSKSAVDNSDDVEAVKPVEQVDIPAGAYSPPKESPARTLPTYERR